MAKTEKKLKGSRGRGIVKKAAPAPVRPVCAVCGSILPDIATPSPDPDGGPWLKLVWSNGRCIGRCAEWAKARSYNLTPGGAYQLDGDKVEEVVEIGDEAARAAVFAGQFLKLGDPGDEQICAVFEVPYAPHLRYAQPVEV